MPLISVVMPAHNSERYLLLAVKSILWQTIKDFELIIVNDGSSDSTAKIIDRLERKYSFIRSVTLSGVGPAEARLEGFRIARGEYIALMDSDDISSPWRFRVQLNKLIKCKLDVVGGSVFVFGKTYPRIWRYPAKESGILSLALFNSPLANPTAFGKASLFQNDAFSICNTLPAEDYRMWVKMIGAGVKISNVSDVVLFYRIHAAQISSAKRYAQKEARTSVAKLMWVQSFSEAPLLESFHCFSSLTEFRRFIDFAEKKSINLFEPIVFNQLKKMIIRSPSSVRRSIVNDWSENLTVINLLLINAFNFIDYAPR